jgi:serine protease inhibitor
MYVKKFKLEKKMKIVNDLKEIGMKEMLNNKEDISRI